jgi:hypothetical protein
MLPHKSLLSASLVTPFLMREREREEKESRSMREMENLSLLEILYDIIYDIKNARIWQLKNAKSHNNISINF